MHNDAGAMAWPDYRSAGFVPAACPYDGHGEV